jgi:hypothetical protein
MPEAATSCPHCGATTAGGNSGMFQTSTVMISSGGADRVYRSVEEVPHPLRTRLLKSTNGANSATILIADRRGRKEIAKAMRNLPAHAQRKLMQSVLANSDEGSWLAQGPRRAVLAAVILLALAAVAFVFFRVG